MTAVQRALYHIITGKKDFCCFCFETIEEQEKFHIIDEVVFNQNIELFEILAYVVGDQCLDIITFGAVCKECTTSAINSYKFIKMCQENTQQFYKVVDAFHDYFKHVTLVDGFKSLLLALNKDFKINEYSVQQSNNDKLKKNLETTYKKQSIQTEADNYVDLGQEAELALQSINNTKKKITLHGCDNKLKICDIIHDRNCSIYKCKDCLKVFPHAWNLKQHFVRVHAPKKFQCNKCSKSYGSELILKLHISQSHCTVVCSECGKTYQNTYSLKKHEMGHKVRLTCETCGKIYKGKRSFDNHIKNKLCLKKRKSNSEAKFTCNYCKKKYSQKIALSIHIQVEHENGRAYICQWCSKKFASQSKLKEHVVKHTKEKKFCCQLCGGRYVTKASLLYHTRTHTGERPYKCIHCNSSFLSASRRSDHIRRHHMSPSLECEICHRKFRDRRCFLKHKKRHYNPNKLFSDNRA